MDRDLSFLRQATNDDLEPLVGYILNAELSETLSINDKFKQHWPNHHQYVDLIEREIRDFGGNRFFIGTESVQAYFGVAGRTFYVTPDKGLAAHADGPETLTLAEWEKEIKGSRFFLWFNLAQLHNVPGWPGGSDLFGSLVLRSSDARHFTLDVRGEKGRNVWKDLLK